MILMQLLQISKQILINFGTSTTLKNDFANPNSSYFIAKLDDEIVGFAGFLKICDEANIMNIVTKVDKRHLGIGSKLMQALIDEAKKQNLKSITLEVNDKNIPAIKLYEKFNFKRIGLRKKYYNNTDDAIIMSLEPVPKSAKWHFGARYKSAKFLRRIYE